MERQCSRPSQDTMDGGLIWHYTGFQAFLDIINTKTLWLSETTYLNDRDEMAAGLRAVENWLSVNAESNVIDAFKRANPPQVFVASFSRNGDLLSQWRAYCPTGGVALGFDPEVLRNCFLNFINLQPCIYKAPDANDSLLIQMAEIFAGNTSFLDTPYDRHDIYLNSGLYKHASFIEEDEVRAIFSTGDHQNRAKIFVRASATRLIRCIKAEWKLKHPWEIEEACALRAIRLGPVEPGEKQTMMDAIQAALLSENGDPVCPAIQVTATETPLRRMLKLD